MTEQNRPFFLAIVTHMRHGTPKTEPVALTRDLLAAYKVTQECGTHDGYAIMRPGCGVALYRLQTDLAYDSRSGRTALASGANDAPDAARQLVYRRVWDDAAYAWTEQWLREDLRQEVLRSLYERSGS